MSRNSIAAPSVVRHGGGGVGVGIGVGVGVVQFLEQLVQLADLRLAKQVVLFVGQVATKLGRLLLAADLLRDRHCVVLKRQQLIEQTGRPSASLAIGLGCNRDKMECFHIRIVKVWNELPEKTVAAPNECEQVGQALEGRGIPVQF